MIVGEPKIEMLLPKTLVGMRSTITQADNRTADLWRQFMPRRGDIAGAAGPELYAVRVYPAGYFSAYNPELPFTIWAALAVADSTFIPPGMEAFALPGGAYAVFTYRGLPQGLTPDFLYMMNEWLPRQGYAFDDRPHVAVMGERYRHGEEDSEEEIWMPMRKR